MSVDVCFCLMPSLVTIPVCTTSDSDGNMPIEEPRKKKKKKKRATSYERRAWRSGDRGNQSTHSAPAVSLGETPQTCSETLAHSRRHREARTSCKQRGRPWENGICTQILSSSRRLLGRRTQPEDCTMLEAGQL